MRWKRYDVEGGLACCQPHVFQTVCSLSYGLYVRRRKLPQFEPQQNPANVYFPRICPQEVQALDDVIVVGGGPVGSNTAFRLAQMGHGVTLIDRKWELDEPVCCTGIISEECIRRYRVDRTVIFRHFRGARLYSPSGKETKIERATNQAAIVNRPAFNELMSSRALEAGAKYFGNSNATNIKVERDHVELTVVSDGETRSLRAQGVILATGSHGSLTEQAGLGRARNLVGGAQAMVETSGVTEVEVYTGNRIAPNFFAWLAPTSSGHALAGLLSKRDPQGRLVDFLDSLVTLGKVVSRDVAIITGAVPLKAIPRSYSDRLLVVGTAAGQVKPITGGGIYYGLLASDIAAQQMHAALVAGDLSKRALEAYEHEWMDLLSQELTAGYRARTVFEHLGDRGIELMFDMVQSQGIAQKLMSEEDVTFDWHSKAMRHLLQEHAFAKLVKGFRFPLR